MPLYLVERTYCHEPAAAAASPGEAPDSRPGFYQNNRLAGATWIGSCLTLNGRRSFCLYEAAGPESVRRAASLNGLPVDRINAVTVHTPGEGDGAAWFYLNGAAPGAAPAAGEDTP
jgi:hypothetical protein